MYGCESWTIKKADHQIIDAFQLWCCRRLLRVLWSARRSNQSILKEINPECSLEGLMLKLKFQYFGYLMQKKKWSRSVVSNSVTPRTVAYKASASMEFSRQEHWSGLPFPSLDEKSQLIGKDIDAGKDGGQEEKRASEDEMVGWHHLPNVHEFEQTPGDSEGQGSLAAVHGGHKQSDMT